MILDNHFRKKTSLIAPVCFSFSTSYFTASTCCLPDLLGFCFFGGKEGSTLSLWVIKSGSTLGPSYGLQEKISKFYTNVNNKFTRSSCFILTTIWKLQFSYGSMPTLTTSLVLFACWPSVGSCNCYARSCLADSFCLISWLTVATKHGLAT